MKRSDLKNEARVIGEIKDKEIIRKNEGKEDESIRINLKVRVSEVEEHDVSFFAYKYTKNSKDERLKTNPVSKLFEGYETMAKEYKFISDEKGDGTGEKVDIKGALDKNMYVGKDGKLKEPIKISGKFCSRIKDESKYTPCAVFSIHMHITKMDDEAKDVTGEYTKVTGMVLGYNKEDEIEFRIYNPKVRKGFDKVFAEGDSALFKGNIINRPDEAQVESTDDDDAGWGEEMEVEADSATIMRRYLEILTGDKKPMDTDDEDHPLNEDKVKKYKKNIAKRKADTIAKHEEEQKSGNKGGKDIDPNKGEEDIEDIPF